MGFAPCHSGDGTEGRLVSLRHSTVNSLSMYLTIPTSGSQVFVLPPELLAALHLSAPFQLISISSTDVSGTLKKEEERVLYLSSESSRSNLY